MIVRLRRLAPEAEEEEWARHTTDVVQGQLTLSKTTVYPASAPTCCSRPLLRRNVALLSVRPTARAQQTAARRFSPFLLFGVDLLTVKRMMTRLALLTRQVRSSRPWAGEVPATRCHRTRPSKSRKNHQLMHRFSPRSDVGNAIARHHGTYKYLLRPLTSSMNRRDLLSIHNPMQT